ncbi:two-component system, chemotaxis family, CheB/CheR fusion protein [Trichlorobacter thiogenes]|uniref:Two-component system, chemotaxis family, CheB/CheR fusion protein n=1 Tax=Trichlorobacter thiogenes TaxID=115783 RepID=A0A1T4MGR2_9BACT|nr:CheR family methyltransferase [Trichlorobacter thiogenes]SJZ66209.1 two-component system, chemotaxis family, CheB/CheR fusion protein [Trichlorobacter thiogenes]
MSDSDNQALPESELLDNSGDESTTDWQPVTDLLRRVLGIDFGCYRSGTVGRRISRRMEMLQLDDPADYVTLLSADQEEVELLGRDLLIGVTEFFRDPQVFRGLEEQLRELLRGRSASDGFRVWSAGCATGEEAYSLAVLLHSIAQEVGFSGDLKVFATDVHKGALEIASRGAYCEDLIAGMPTPFLERYFRAEEEGCYRIDPQIRRMLVFAHHNLLSDPPFTRIDLAVCRNMLIYLQPDAQQRVLTALQFSLVPGGLLLLGPSEGVSHLPNAFSSVQAGIKLFRKQATPRDSITVPGIPWMARNPLIASLHQGPRNAIALDRHLLHDYDLILERYAPPGMLLNSNRQVLHIFGDLTRYLRPLTGRLSGDILGSLRDELRPALSTALLRAEQQHENSVVDRIPLLQDTGCSYVDLSVSCLRDDRSNEMHFHVTLAPSDWQPTQESDRVSCHHDAADSAAHHRLSDLEQELHSTRHSLQLTIEELQASNEKLDLANEELISSNEELQSTNEELKSVNEDLYAVNGELERRNEELLRLNSDHDNLLASTEVGTVFLDQQLCIRKFSSAISGFMKLLPQDLGRPIDHIAYELSSPQEFRRNLIQVLETGLRMEQEIQSGPDQWVLQRILPYKGEDGTVDGVVLTFTDISAVKQAQAAVAEMNIQLEQKVQERTRELSASEANMRAFIESSVQGFWQLGPDRLTIKVNPALSAMLGYSPEEMLGRSPVEFAVQESRPAFLYQLGRVEGTLHRNFELNLQHKNGDPVPVMFHATTLFDENDTVKSSFAFVTDLSEQKKVEQEIRLARDAAESANRAKTQFLANISHEVRTPLNGIMGMSNLLHMTPLVDEQLDYLRHLDDSAQSLLSVINDLLDLTRIESGGFGMEQADFDPDELANDILRIHQPVAQRKGVGLQLKLAPDLPATMRGVPSRLKQVLHNLVGNAVKFTDQGQIVLQIEALSQPGQPLHARFRVTDTGIGMEPDTLSRIFAPFTQADETISRRYGGTGLGLAICQRLTELMGGSIEVESTPGVGSCFTVTLPMKVPLGAIMPHNLAEKAPVHTQGQSLRVLLAEDQPVGRLYATRLLERLGHRVTAVEDGKAALEGWVKGDFDLILMDVQMPGMDGVAATSAIRTQEKGGDRHTPIIALTAHALTGDRGKLLEHGFDGYVAKPIDVDELVTEVSRLMRQDGSGFSQKEETP